METPEGTVYSGAARWFSSDGVDGDGPNGWRLDVVTLLAVIGESSIAEHAQVITASVLCLLPRIIPAPQALLKPTRPQRLPETKAKMTGVYSGVVLDTVGFFANIIHPLDDYTAFSFQVLEIKHTDRNNAGGVEVPQQPPSANGSAFFQRLRSHGRTNTNLSLAAKSIKGPPPDALDYEPRPIRGQTTGLSVAFSEDLESGPDPPPQGITRRQTMKEKVQDFVTNPTTLANKTERPAIPATLSSPIHILEVFSVVLTFAIIGFAIWQKDGTAIIAVTLMAGASSVVGYASWWKPRLMNRSHTNKVPDGDVIIRTREGAFLLIKCTEEVARELYSGTEECEYHVGGQTYRALMGLGTFLLMASVILLGNCKWKSQIFVSAAYVVLNGLYWTLGLLPKHLFWDLSRYDCKIVTPPDSEGAETETDPNDPREGARSFTRTLWWAIRETKRTAWVQRSDAAPRTPQWGLWLAEAEAAAKAGNRGWKAVARKDEIMKMTEEEIANGPPTAPPRAFDEAEQAAPAAQIQPHDQGPSKGGAF